MLIMQSNVVLALPRWLRNPSHLHGCNVGVGAKDDYRQCCTCPADHGYGAWQAGLLTNRRHNAGAEVSKQLCTAIGSSRKGGIL